MARDKQVLAFISGPPWTGWSPALQTRVEFLLWLDVISSYSDDCAVIAVSSRPDLGAAVADERLSAEVVWCDESQIVNESARLARDTEPLLVFASTANDARLIAGRRSSPLLVADTPDAYTTITIGEPAPLGWRAITAAGLSVVVSPHCCDTRLRRLRRGQRMHAVVDGSEVRACWIV